VTGSTIAATYTYRDEDGRALYECIRLEPKSYRQRRLVGGRWQWSLDGVRRVLYRLPFLLAEPDAVAWIAEGEKDADRLAAEGLCATTNVCGAGAWRAEYGESLRGRRCVVLPDNDDAGEKRAREVEAALRGVAAACVVLRLRGLPPKGDVSDWLDAGGTVGDLRAMADSLLRDAQAFAPSPERLSGDREARIASGRKTLLFGVDFLDAAIAGIAPRDVVLVGAKTGTGKTALATMTALAACRQGRRVHYFALEADDNEIERRMKYEIIAKEYYRTSLYPRPIRFLEWDLGRLDDELGSLDGFGDDCVAELAGNLHTYYRGSAFTAEDFINHTKSIQADTDLIILDHLHYVDSVDDNENRAQKQVLKSVRDVALRYGKPVILVAHVRKSDRRNDTLVPSIEDFHGSSDIGKIATKAIVIAPAYDIPSPEPYLWPTYIQIAKCRQDSSVCRYAAIATFNARTNTYEPGYTLGKITDAGRTFQSMAAADYPAWAKQEFATSDTDEIQAPR